MKKVDLSNYEVDGTRVKAVCPQCKQEPPEIQEGIYPSICPECQVTLLASRVACKVPVNVKDQLVNLLYHPQLRLTASQARERRVIRRKLLDANSYIYLEDAEYEKVKQGMDVAQGFGAGDLELIDRIYDAETVKVEDLKTQEELSASQKDKKDGT